MSDGGKQWVAAFMHLHFIDRMIDVSPGLVVHLWFPHNRSWQSSAIKALQWCFGANKTNLAKLFFFFPSSVGSINVYLIGLNGKKKPIIWGRERNEKRSSLVESSVFRPSGDHNTHTTRAALPIQRSLLTVDMSVFISSAVVSATQREHLLFFLTALSRFGL